MLSLQPHPPPTLICHGLYGGILQVSPVVYSYLVAKYQMSSGPYGPIFFHIDDGDVSKDCTYTGLCLNLQIPEVSGSFVSS